MVNIILSSKTVRYLNPQPVRSGGETNTTTSPLTNNIPTDRVAFFTISSSVSSSISCVVTVSSTSPNTIFRCWSYAYKYENHERERSVSSKRTKNYSGRFNMSIETNNWLTWSFPRSSLSFRHLTYTRSSIDNLIKSSGSSIVFETQYKSQATVSVTFSLFFFFSLYLFLSTRAGYLCSFCSCYVVTR